MVKRIIATLVSGIAVLLVLLFFIIVIFNFQDFFGPALTWLLVGCVGVLMVFVIYLVLSWIADAVRRRKLNEDKLSEQSLEKLLSGDAPRQRKVSSNAQKRKDKQQHLAQKRADKRAMEEEKNIRKQEEYEAKRTAEENEKRKKIDDAKAKQLAEAHSKAKQIEAAEEAARKRAEKPEIGDDEKQLALAQAQALKRAAVEAQQRIEEEVATQKAEKEQLEQEQREKETQEAQRKAQAIASARRQAEAVAAARRRAAQTAARTQAFAPINTENLPAFNAKVVEKGADVQATRAAKLSSALNSVQQPVEYTQADTIWDRMQVRQSAAPILGLGSSDSVSEYTSSDVYAATQATLSSLTAAAKSLEKSAGNVNKAEQKKNKAGEQADAKASNEAAQEWNYTPAKLPNAWKADSTARKIPGDMSFVNTMSMPAVQEKESDVQATKRKEKSASTVAQVNKQSTVADLRDEGNEGAGKSRTTGSSSTRSAFKPIVGAEAQKAKEAQSSDASGGTKTSRATASFASIVQSDEMGTVNQAASTGSVENEIEAKRSRGRPPKPKDVSAEEQPKRPRGRPPKPKDPSEEEQPKRPRGRPPKPKDPNEAEQPKRPRGRPPKTKDQGDQE